MNKPRTAKSRAKPGRPVLPARLVLVTGMSGAGRSTALKALEDIGYEAVDNLPLSLLANLIGPQSGFHRPLAVGVDVRTRDFDVAHFAEAVERLEKEAEGQEL